MASSVTPDNSGSAESCDSSEVVTQIFLPNPDIAPTEYDCFRVTDEEAAAILIKASPFVIKED
jgi:hypothetical protein